jgi:Fic family protein
MSRGLARSEAAYKLSLDAADEHRMGDLDGRGNLSERRLVDFCEFTLKIAQDQVKFMSQLFAIEKLEKRCWQYFNNQSEYRPESAHLYLHAIHRGEFERGEAGRLTGLSERTARDILGKLVQDGFLVSDTPKGRVRAGFPLLAMDAIFPNLYPAGENLNFAPTNINQDDLVIPVAKM